MNKKSNFNLNHPEKHPDEIWLENVSIFHRGDDFNLYRDDEGAMMNMNQNCSYTTKRLGKVAYTVDGNELCDYKPVFVKRSEYANIHCSQT